MAHPNIPGGFSSEEARQKALQGSRIAPKKGGHMSGTMANNQPVGGAGQPASMGNNLKIKAGASKSKMEAISRRIAKSRSNPKSKTVKKSTY